MQIAADSDNEIRVGVVSYLNVQPLVWAFHKGLLPRQTKDGCQLRFIDAVPSLLAQWLRRGECHVGIVPTFEYFAHPGYTIVPAGAIATRRRVGSVIIVANAPLERLSRIVLDPASLTSVNLLYVLKQEYRWPCELVKAKASSLSSAALAQWLHSCSEPAGQLLIGDPALTVSGMFPYTYDLGGLWFELTGLPFVFAAWLAHPAAQSLPLTEILSLAKELGLTHLRQLAQECAPSFGFSPEFAEQYFQENLCFHLGEEEILGMREFGKLCAKWGLCAHEATQLRFHQF